MMRAASGWAGLRWVAAGIAALAGWDPAIARTRTVKPAIDIAGPSRERADVERRLRAAGFTLNAGAPPAALVMIGDRPPTSLPPVPLWAFDTSTRDGNVRVTEVSSAASRFPAESARVRAQLAATRMEGQTTEVTLETNGVTVASAQHRWTSASERWTAVLDYLPPEPGPGTLRVVARPLGSETTSDNVADVRVPGVRAALRVLAYDASVSWPAAFVRRSLEGHPAFALVARQRVSPATSTQAGTPPRVLSEATLTAFEAIVVGSPDELSRGEVRALRWFVEQRGGVLVFVADGVPRGSYRELLGVAAFDSRSLREPVALDEPGTPLRAAELIVARGLSPGSRVLARMGPDAVVVSSPRGEGRVVFFGAVDAWRSRAADRDGFARFWRRLLLSEAHEVPPRLAIDVEPSLVSPGQRVHVGARLRQSELDASAGQIVVPPATATVARAGGRQDERVRLWPTAEPGVFEGEWIASGTGEVDMTVTVGAITADATLSVAERVMQATDADPEGLALAAHGSGGEVHSVNDIDRAVAALTSRVPARAARVVVHPMRSPLWLLPFAAALAAEWAWRRRTGRR